MNEQAKKYLDVLFNDKNLIIYRPELRQIAGSITAAILLNQIIYWWAKNGRKKFYKFKNKCTHEKYKDGDSWCEELGFSQKEFDNAIKKIGFKLGKTKNIIDKDDAIVIYYRDREGLTWYSIQEELLENKLSGIYNVNDQREFTIEGYQREFSKENDERVFSNNNVTETTTKTTTENYLETSKDKSFDAKKVSMFRDGKVLYDYDGNNPVYRQEEELDTPHTALVLKIMKYVVKSLPAVARMQRPLSFVETEKLVKKYDSDSIVVKLQAMENLKNLNRKYKSTYFTLNNWLKK